MRVGHANLARGFRGGERQTELLVRELADRGVEQRLVCRRGGALAGRMADVPGLEVRPVVWPYLPFVGAFRGVDVIHVHDGKSPTLAALASAVFGVPYLITRRMQAPPGSGVVTRGAYGRAAALVALSQGIRDRLAAWSGRHDIRVVPSAAAHLPVDDDEVARLRARYQGCFLVVCPSALVYGQKGQEHLIEAARRLASSAPEVRVLLLGRGSGEARFRELARGLDNVEFGGFVENLGDYLAAADVLALPSLHEGLGSVLLDAFDAGLPVVASRIPGVVDVVRHEVNGLLVPPADPGALASALARLLADPLLRDALAEGARASAADYAPALMADRYLELYRALAGHGVTP